MWEFSWFIGLVKSFLKKIVLEENSSFFEKQNELTIVYSIIQKILLRNLRLSEKKWNFNKKRNNMSENNFIKVCWIQEAVDIGRGYL